MRITMIGTGYVGLVSGACFSEFGAEVICVDCDASKIDRLNRGEIPIFENGLEELVTRNHREGRLLFQTDTAKAVAASDVVFIAVGTPERRGDGAADLRYVFQAAHDVARGIQKFTVVVTKSTVPVGTGQQVARIIREENPEADFEMASNPEFLREGAAIEDFMKPDRVVIGVESDRAAQVLRNLYRPLYLSETPILITNIATAELTKYAANAFLATKITFINQLANLCESVGADVHHVAKGMGLDQRIGSQFLQPGPGYGGSCFPKDTQALVKTAREHGQPMGIVEQVIEANRLQKERMVDKIVGALSGTVAGKQLAVLGLTFKSNTDDLRDAPALTILPALLRQGAIIRAYDPEGMRGAAQLLPGVEMVQGPYEACKDADALIILTEWNQFRNLQLDRLKTLLKPQPGKGHIFCDLRNIYEPALMKELGFHYICVGR
ncbi:MAG: UDP-glucose/GDP-mannose dehydrogenase family protein [Nitrospirae bacterium]|nr:UDP-glucose/GDP-mannose dehydrogenase family protein [Magnetococcales bacterium]HAT49527.1 UDP-glucose 6-dehydrogenase [Alphaproteobacteria bacterium]